MGSYPLQMFSSASVPGSGFVSQLFGGPTTASAAANSQVIRPTMVSTFRSSRRHRQRGGATRKQKKQNQKTRKQRGGFFSPSVMGPFLKNVEALAAPISIYLGYKMLKAMRSGKKSRKNRV